MLADRLGLGEETMRLPRGSLAVALALALGASLAAPQRTVAQTPPGPAVAADSASVAIPDDLNLLIGKRVVVGRIPLCTPKTYAVNLSYSGKTAKVISFTRNSSLDAIKGRLRYMPAATQTLMADMMKGGLVLFEFEDGTRLDSCAAIGWNTITAQLELAPGETIVLPVDAQRSLASAPEPIGPPPMASAASPQQCPVAIVKLSSGVSFAHMFAEALTTSEFQRQVDETIHNGQDKHYLDIRVRNDSAKPVSAFEFGTTYLNRMGDAAASATYISQNTHSIGPNEEIRASAMDRDTLAQTGSGQVRVYIGRVKFDDGSLWQDDGTHSCSRTTGIN